jgi:lipoprotein NlpD
MYKTLTLCLCGVMLLANLSGCGRHVVAPVVDRSIAKSSDVQAARTEHWVVRGETLYGLAFRYGLDYRLIAEWNHIEPPYTIYPGQRLQLSGAETRNVESQAIPEIQGVEVTAVPSMAEEGALIAEPLSSELVKPQSVAVPPKAMPSGDYARSEPQVANNNLKPNSQERATTLSSVIGVAAHSKPSAKQVHHGHEQEESLIDARARSNSEEKEPQLSLTTDPDLSNSEKQPVSSVVPARTQTVSGVQWRWPTDGRLQGGYDATDPGRRGIDIQATLGQVVVAAADGEVVYSGHGLIGYGELVIVKHTPEFLSAYGYNRKRLVSEGQRVKAGQAIAEVGTADATGSGVLHFEIRRAGKPVNPLGFLPRR